MPRTTKSGYERKMEGEGERKNKRNYERKEKMLHIDEEKTRKRERREAHLNEACPDTRDTRIEFDHRIRIHETRDLSWIILVSRLILFLSPSPVTVIDAFFPCIDSTLTDKSTAPKISFASETRRSDALIFEKMFMIIRYEKGESFM